MTKYMVEIEGTDRLLEDHAGNRRGRRFVVVEHSWKCEPAIISWHASWSAAQRAAERHDRRFSQKYPNGYGYSWEPYCI